MLFYRPNIFFFIDSTAVGTNPIPTNGIIFAMPALDSGEFIFIFVILSVLESSVLAEPDFKFLNLTVKIIDNIFILADVQSD